MAILPEGKSLGGQLTISEFRLLQHFGVRRRPARPGVKRRALVRWISCIPSSVFGGFGFNQIELTKKITKHLCMTMREFYACCLLLSARELAHKVTSLEENRSFMYIALLCSEVPPLRLLSLNSLEQALEVSCSKAFKLVALNNLNEDRRAIHKRLGKELEQVTALIVIDQDVEPLQRRKVLLQLPVALLRLHPRAHLVIVGAGHVDELHAS